MRTDVHFYKRLIEPRLLEALEDTPVVLLAGPRQAGKTTLVRKISERGAKYLTLDDESVLWAAKQDPVGFIRNLDRAIIDEIQRVPELLLAIKKSVDEDRRAGRFLLTGSANVLALPKVADSLAGRIETLTLYPLSQAEISGSSDNWLDAIFDGQVLNPKNLIVGSELVETVLKGSYPEALTRDSIRRRMAWGRQYIDSIVRRDVRDVAGVNKLDQLPRFLRALAHVSGQMSNYTKLGGQIGVDNQTASHYVSVFELVYLLKRVEPWASNRLKRVVKTPKIQFLDSGLLSTLIDLSPSLANSDRQLYGKVLESFVYGELLKCSAASEGDYRLFYYRDRDQLEVDFVVENAAGQLVGIEIKAAASVSDKDLKGLRRFADLTGDKFQKGILFYDGGEVLSLGQKNWAVPISSLWGVSPSLAC